MCAWRCEFPGAVHFRTNFAPAEKFDTSFTRDRSIILLLPHETLNGYEYFRAVKVVPCE